jgi:hypothetical protein
LLNVGDIKFCAHCQGQENMSGSWCMWCNSHLMHWKMHPSPECEFWAVPKIKESKRHADAKALKEPSDICGIVNNPTWDFVEPAFMVFPQFHVEIGLVNNVPDNFYSFIDVHVEVPTDEEKCSQNSYIMAATDKVSAKTQ